ncbi:MAG: glycoside hydrolase family 127 protein [Paludibacter sp.]|nr:glycoside hydrolase family 127 protein [Paludibacter sp.]
MKKIIVFILILFAIQTGNSQSLKTIPLNEIKAAGWMKNQLLRDISTGYIANYEKLQPTMQMNVFGPVKAKNYSIDKAGNWIARRETWWPGEHEGFYADLVVRSAFLTAYQPWLEKAKKTVDYVVKNQEPSGYIGIYDEECRLDNLLNENGEFWTQSRILGALLAYYEFSGEKKYFEAARKAMDYTIERYRKSGKSYFHQPKPNGGGLTHGLMIVETLEWLYRLTNDKKYLDFAIWVYEDYSSADEKIGATDMQLAKMLDRELMYRQHGAHVCEHYRVILFLANKTNNPLYKKAAENALYKIKRSLNPSGSIALDTKVMESVAYNYGSPDLPSEYCTSTELIISFSSGMQKQPDAGYGDMVERILFNAAQGARLADGSAVIYLNKDNAKQALQKDNFRYQYAACHSVACCNLNAAKAMPYYISNMWMKSIDDKTIVATLLGPSEVNTRVNGTMVKIEESTLYPFENTIRFKVSPEKKKNFTLSVRNPSWSKNTQVKIPGASFKIENGFIYVSKEWQQGDVCEIKFETKIQAHKTMANEYYLTRGALLYAVPVPDIRQATKEFDGGLKNWDVMPRNTEEADNIFTKYKVQRNLDINMMDGKTEFTYVPSSLRKTDYPYDVPYGTVEADFIVNKQPSKVTLLPYGSTTLRKTTFSEDK